MRDLKLLDRFDVFAKRFHSIIEHYVPELEISRTERIISSLYDMTVEFDNVSICKHMGENEIEWVITLSDEDDTHKRIDKYTITESGMHKVESNMDKKLWARIN